MSTKRPFEAKIRIRGAQVLLSARSLPSQFENAYYHVTCRGKGGQEIFSIEADRSKSLIFWGARVMSTGGNPGIRGSESLWGWNQREIGGLAGIDYNGVSVSGKDFLLQEKDPYLTARGST